MAAAGPGEAAGGWDAFVIGCASAARRQGRPRRRAWRHRRGGVPYSQAGGRGSRERAGALEAVAA